MALLYDAASGLVARSADAVEVRRAAERSPPGQELSCSLPHRTPPETPPWTWSSCALLALFSTGGAGPARTHGAPSRCVWVGLGLPQSGASQDDTSGRRPW